MKKIKLTKEEWLLVFYILKKSKKDRKTEFVWINPLTHLYLAVSMIHLGFLYIIQGENFKL